MSATETETKARALGWSPKENFRGDSKHWVDAETYVRRGEEMMPILKENNKRLEEQLASTKSELAATKALVEESQTAIKDLAKFNTEVMRERAKDKKAELLAGIKEAKKDGNVDVEVELTDQLSEHNAALAKAEEKPAVEVKPKVEANPTVEAAKAEFTAWKKDNDWYDKDLAKTGTANGVAAQLRAEGSPLVGKAFYDEVAKRTDALLGGNTRRTAPDKTEGGGRGTGPGGGGSDNGVQGKDYSDLDDEAKAACEKFNKTLVGPGKSYKTVEDWRKAYAAEYFARS